jgi:hypothetical protein
VPAHVAVSVTGHSPPSNNAHYVKPHRDRMERRKRAETAAFVRLRNRVGSQEVASSALRREPRDAQTEKGCSAAFFGWSVPGSNR